MPPTEQDFGQLRAQGTLVDPPRRRHVQVGAVAHETCAHCGHTLSTAELIDEHGETLATMLRCNQCTGRHRHRDQS